LEAAAIAEAAEDPQRLFDALSGYDHVVRFEGQGEFVRQLGVVLRLVGPEDSPLRATAMAWRQTQTSLTEAPLRDRGELDQAVAMARRTGDRNALASTLLSRCVVSMRGPDASAALRDAEEFASLDVPARTHWMLRSHHLAFALLRLGRRADAEVHVAANKREAERSGLGMAIKDALMLQSMIATASGDYAAGKRLAAEAAGPSAELNDTLFLAYAAQLVAVWYEQGRGDRVITSLQQLDRDIPAFTPWWAMLSAVLAETGQLDEAGVEMRRLMPRFEGGFTALYGGPLAVRYVAETCRHLGERTWADLLLPHVEPWSGILLVANNTSIEGAADRSLGHLLATVGRLDEAICAYAAAAELERRAGFPPLHARTGYWHARALLERGSPGDRQRATELLAETIEITERLGMGLLHQQAIDLAGR
jgi:tetratricopeptide (TPR) repeat protein